MRDSSFEEFVRDSLPALRRYAYALTGGRFAGEDLVQDTLVKLVGGWRRVRRDGNPLGYARTVMFRTYVSRWRLHRRRPALESFEDAAATGDPYADVEPGTRCGGPWLTCPAGSGRCWFSPISTT